MANQRLTAFGDCLKHYRLAAGLTQESLAERAGLSVRGVSDLERGRRTKPYFGTVRLLADALDLSAADRQSFYAAARADEPVGAPIAASEALTNLPVLLTSLVGRTTEVSAVGQLLDRNDVRLVNLTGPGGVGKTRIALQVAGERRASFPDGVFIVALAALRDPGLVVPTIAHTVGLRDTSEPPLALLMAHLQRKRLLLVLDNFEHLLAAAPVLSDLLAACSELKVLSTSRSLLRLTGENEYAVPPLTVPDPSQAADLARLRQVPAAALFFQRLSAISPRPVLTESDASAIVEICARTDGLPLAIELAAARVRHLTIPDLAVRLQRRLQILTHGPRDLPRRQQTLRDTIAWSYDLLAPEEQRLLRWLSVFVGGWTLASAEALGGAEAGVPVEITDGLAALVDSSLVQLERDAAGRARNMMLETIREFAEEQLVASGEEEKVRRHHADVMLAFTDQVSHGLQSGERTAWAHAVPVEVDNVRAALRWSLDHDETERALRIVGNLGWFWDALGRESEGWTWCQAALAKENADRDGLAYARALAAAGELAWNLGDFARSFELLTRSVARLRCLDDPRSLALALLDLGLTTLSRGDRLTAGQHVREAIAIFETIADPWNLGLARFVLGEVLVPDNRDAARTSYERSLALFRSIGDPWGIAQALTGLGELAMHERDYPRARVLMEEGLELRRSINNPHAIAISLVSLGELARREGDDAQAAVSLEEGLARFRALGDAEHVAWALYNLGTVAVHRGNAEEAAAAFGECLALRADQGNVAQILKTIAAVARVAVLTGDAERAAQLWGPVEGIRAAHGVATPTDEDGEEEQRTAVLVQAALGAIRASEAQARGQSRSLTAALSMARETIDAIHAKMGGRTGRSASRS